MITEKEIKAFQKQLRSGVPGGEIKEAMKRTGYSEEDINIVFAPKKYDMRSWYLVSAALIFVLGIYTWLNSGEFLFLVLSAVMFSLYYTEQQRQKAGN